MERYDLKGKCYYCNEKLSERTVKKHVKGCKVRKEKIGESIASSKKTKGQYILSILPQYGSKEYSLYIAIDIDLTLKNLDCFLRNIWLECCGHLSSFIIDDINYDSCVDDEFELFPQTETMDFKLRQVISVGDKFKYDYDFGSTTALKLEVIDEYVVGENYSQIEILSRNDEIQNFCEDCVDEDSDMVGEFEYTNSPRDGVCGYVGNRDAEKQYLPGNKFKIKKTKTKGRKDIVPFIEDDEFNVDDFKGDFESLLDIAMDDMNSEVGYKAKKLLNRLKRGKFTHNLRELLECDTKDELLKTTSMLNITRVSKFNKGQLIEKLLEVYEEKITKDRKSVV